MGSTTYGVLEVLGELMQCHLCPIKDPILVQPYILDPTSCIKSSGLSWSESHAPIYTAHPPVAALNRPLSPFTFRMQLQVLKQRTGFLAICPHQPFPLVPTPTRYPAVLALWGSFLTPVCLYILVPLSQSQGAVPQDTEGRWKTGPAVFSCSSGGSLCSLSSHLPRFAAAVVQSLSCVQLFETSWTAAR